jgi:dopamine beta-monooxygenase
VGIPIGESDSTFFVMQVHFDNEPLKFGVVYNSSWQIFYTHQLKQFDASSFTLASSHANSLIIPPNQNNFTTKVICYSECLSEVSKLIFNIGKSYN